MALEDIQKKIISDAEQKKSVLLELAHKQSAEILDQAHQLAREYQEDHQKHALSFAENSERGLVIDARRKLANEMLAKKRNRIEQIFTKAKLEFISSPEYTVIMHALVCRSIVSKKEEVILGQDEQFLNQQWLDRINQSVGASLVFSKEKGSFHGGVILSEGLTFVNITIDTLFALLREDSEKPVADILFGR
ncbi:MAG: V-type ATP synthase subunit E [Brevinema sp.]